MQGTDARTLLERSQPGVTLASTAGQEAHGGGVDATGWAPGLYPLTAAVEMQNPQAERSLEDNRVTLSLWLLRPGETLEQTFAAGGSRRRVTATRRSRQAAAT